MTIPANVCPKCGADWPKLQGMEDDMFACGSGFYEGYGKPSPGFHQSDTCRIRELEAENQRLRGEYDAADASLKDVVAENERLREVESNSKAFIDAVLATEPHILEKQPITEALLDKVKENQRLRKNLERINTIARGFGFGQGELDDDLPGVVAKIIDQLAKENKRLSLKCNGTLANNLCPDHRDKQANKPCLACEIERLEADNHRIEVWKLDQQQALIAMAVKLYLAGYKGDGLVDGVKWLADENKRLRESKKWLADENKRLRESNAKMFDILEEAVLALQYHIGGNLSRAIAEHCIALYASISSERKINSAFVERTEAEKAS